MKKRPGRKLSTAAFVGGREILEEKVEEIVLQNMVAGWFPGCHRV
jgi:hypothetical protein